ncbi:MAG TPA: GAF domain-containing protein, partial [Usitatibacter sp.]|nr:GAF domain-containing protein [Usitatibacter sp.]
MARPRKRPGPQGTTAAKASSAAPVSTAEQIADLAWAGQHAKAIEWATAALGGPDLSLANRLDLLDLRAESLIAQGELDEASATAAEMVNLANASGKAAFKSQALNSQALVQMRRGDHESAVTTAAAALKAARQCKHASLEALSTLRLAEAQFRGNSLSEDAARNATRAARLYETLGDTVGRGRALWALAVARSDQGRADECQKAAQEALALGRRCGDLYGVGNALNQLSFNEPDIAARLRSLNQALVAYEASGYLERQGAATLNLGVAYARLGLYRRARRLALKAGEIYRRTDNREAFAYARVVLVLTELQMGHLEAARALSCEAAEAIDQVEVRRLAVYVPFMSGQIAFQEGDAQGAVRHLKRSVQMLRATKDFYETVILPYLAQAHLAAGNAPAALAASRRAARMHRAKGFVTPSGVSSPAHIWWTHSQALLANGQWLAAREALETAYRLMIDGIAHVSDEGIRRSYLGHVKVHREIIGAWLKDARKRRLAPARRRAHLGGDSSLREPFERLVDTGLRLNELRSVAELHEFLIEEATELAGAERVLLVMEASEGLELAGSLVPAGEDPQALLREVTPELMRVRRTRMTSLGHSPEGELELEQRSRIIAPLVAQRQLLGYLYADIGGAYGRLHEADRDLLAMLAAQAAVALDNAQWSQGLEQKVAQRTEELQTSNALLKQRAGELAIINSVQEGLASKLDIEAIFALVGDKIREIFAADTTFIAYHDVENNMIAASYYVDRGVTPAFIKGARRGRPYGKGLAETIIESGKPLLMGTSAQQDSHGAFHIASPGAKEDLNQSFLGVPIFRDGKPYGAVSVQSYKEHAYNEGDLRLLGTLASSMSVALENARLFDETQRLYKESE